MEQGQEFEDTAEEFVEEEEEEMGEQFEGSVTVRTAAFDSNSAQRNIADMPRATHNKTIISLCMGKTY